MRTPLAAIAASALALAALTGCTSSDDAEPVETELPPQALTGELTVYAAASLTAAFDELTARFAELEPEVDVRPVVYDGSQALAAQIAEGAPADVFAAADMASVEGVTADGKLINPVPFASNTLALVTPAGNPAGVSGLADLANPDLTVVLCEASVPCGAASEQVLTNAGVTPSIDSAEQSVTAVLTKVRSGEADAGLVYVTDAATTDEVDVVDVDGIGTVVNTYPIAVVNESQNPAVAVAFVEYVLSPEGQQVLAELGFGIP